MFDGMPDQFYQFLAATSRATTPTTPTPATHPTPTLPTSLPLPFPLHHHHHAHAHTYPTTFQQHPSFDPSYLLHQHHHGQLPLQAHQVSRNEVAKQESGPPPTLMLAESDVPWSNEEVLALLKIRSSMDTPWFPNDHFTWDNVSRKLAEVGIKRSADKCKEKFEEETRGFSSSCSSIINTNCSNSNKNISHNYRLFGELEELYNHNSNNDGADCHGNHDHNDGGNHQQSALEPTTHDQLDDDTQPSLSQKDNQSPSSTTHGEVEEHNGEVHGTLLDDEIKEDYARNDKNDEEDADEQDQEQSMDDSEKTTEENTKKVTRKRKRQKKFEMFKGFCEKIVSKMMAQQEELHSKILQDMVKRDEAKIAKEETWKKQEIERITKEMEVRAHEQAIVGDRQAKILDFLKKFTSSTNKESQCLGDTLENLVTKVPKTSLSNSSILSQDSINVAQTTSSCETHDQNPTLVTHRKENVAPQSSNRLENEKVNLPMSPSSLEQISQNPNHVTIQNGSSRLASTSTHNGHKSYGCDHTNTSAADRVMDLRSPDSEAGLKPRVGSTGKDDTGRRWPRDEVLALINIRCSLFNNNNNSNGDHHDKESSTKGPLWERISQKMMELGYKRSAKRCKEKWENINKYFRKTKDLNKRRSIDSRTCPYFHQLNHLYNQGALPGSSSERPENPVVSPENQAMDSSCAQGGSSTINGATTNGHASQHNEAGVVVQAPGFDFEF